MLSPWAMMSNLIRWMEKSNKRENPFPTKETGGLKKKKAAHQATRRSQVARRGTTVEEEKGELAEGRRKVGEEIIYRTTLAPILQMASTSK